jgi:tetratricopeptide (TPR) repeat protein
LALHQEGRFDEAVRLYHQVIAAAPNYPDAYHLLGLCRLMRGDGEACLENLLRAVELAPHQASFHASLANAYQELGRLDDSIAIYRDALAADPAHLGAHINQGYALYDLGRRVDRAGFGL